ncbi:MAG: hypothetical protein IIB02_01510 [Thaumarchaeota archaeon]|nr:hypothetical protein [Nitrososphaerota archaeon]
MSRSKTYQVIQDFDSKKDYGIKLDNRFKTALSKFQKGETFRPKDIAKKLPESNQTLAYDTITFGMKIGILKLVDLEPTSFDEFCQLDSVSYFADQLRGSKYKHQEVKSRKGSTRQLYLYKLWKFNSWLIGKKFKFRRYIATGIDTLKVIDDLIELSGVEDLLKLYQEPHSSDTEFIRTIKTFLLDEHHAGTKASTVSLHYCAIRAYFDRNDSPINFRFDAKTKYDNLTDDEEKPEVTLEDLLKMLTVGRPTIMEKAVVVCKFQRGLDNSTFVDRFNYQAFEQLSDWFGTEQYERWDEANCPAPIKLTRIKNQFQHTGFLDIDAIHCIQDYLKIRYQKTGRILQKGEPMFINNLNSPIKDGWVSNLIRRLAKKSGIQTILKEYERSTRYKQNSHELRDLLKSILIDSGCRLDVADHAIGHMPKDSYEKQTQLFPASLRAEYMKASKRINMFSNISHYMHGDDEKEVLRRQLSDMKLEMEKTEIKTFRESNEMFEKLMSKIKEGDDRLKQVEVGMQVLTKSKQIQ